MPSVAKPGWLWGPLSRLGLSVALVTLVVDSPPGDLAEISDEVHAVRSLAPDSDAVGRVLSL